MLAVNLVSGVFARGVKLLQEAEVVAASNFGNEYGPARVVAAINEVCDKQASDVVVAFLRSDRIQQSLGAVGSSTSCDFFDRINLLSLMLLIACVCLERSLPKRSPLGRRLLSRSAGPQMLSFRKSRLSFRFASFMPVYLLQHLLLATI